MGDKGGKKDKNKGAKQKQVKRDQIEKKRVNNLPKDKPKA